MLLGALVGAGVPLEVLAGRGRPARRCRSRFTAEPVRRGGLAATRVHVEVRRRAAARLWADVRRLLELPARRRAPRTAPCGSSPPSPTAEGRVHGIARDDVHFHEVGALDAIADVVGVCAGLPQPRGSTQLVASPVALGRRHGADGARRLPGPGPAVLELLRARRRAHRWRGAAAPTSSCAPRPVPRWWRRSPTASARCRR